METYVTDCNGKKIDYEAACHYMDDEIRERLHDEMAPCDPQEFVEAYVAEHEKKFDGEEWAPYYGGQW